MNPSQPTLSPVVEKLFAAVESIDPKGNPVCTARSVYTELHRDASPQEKEDLNLAWRILQIEMNMGRLLKKALEQLSDDERARLPQETLAAARQDLYHHLLDKPDLPEEDKPLIRWIADAHAHADKHAIPLQNDPSRYVIKDIRAIMNRLHELAIRHFGTNKPDER